MLGEAVARVRNAEPRLIDIGRLRYVDHQGRAALRHFLNIASFGIGGLVDEIVNRSSKALGGKAAFALATLRAMLRYRHQRVRIRLDGKEPKETHILNVAVANGRFFGGGMNIAPHAELDDGLFDVVELGDLGLVDFVLHGQKLRKGDHLQMPEVSFTRAKRVEAHPAIGERVLLDVDGEQPGMLPATFEIVPRALRLKA
jgi:diacylglycerol kinase family enzyme